MKKIILILFVAVTSAASLSAQTPFFPVQKGMVLDYASKDGKDRVLSYTKYTITKVDVKDDNNMTVGYQIEMFDKKKNQTLAPMDLTVAITDGTVTFDGTSAIGQLTQDMKIEGSGIILPAKLEAGQTLQDYGVTSESLGLVSNCTNVKVVGIESLTVGNNTYECYKVESNVFAKVLFIKTEGKSVAWYARGIGNVRTESYDKKGKLVSVVELIEQK